MAYKGDMQKKRGNGSGLGCSQLTGGEVSLVPSEIAPLTESRTDQIKQKKSTP